MLSKPTYEELEQRVKVLEREALNYKQAEADAQASEELLRESQSLHANLIDLSPVAIYVHQEGKFIFVNPKYSDLLGAHEPSDMIGKSVLDYIHPDHREFVNNRIKVTTS